MYQRIDSLPGDKHEFYLLLIIQYPLLTFDHDLKFVIQIEYQLAPT